MATCQSTSAAPKGNFYGRASEAAGRILRAFEQPSELPKALAPIFIHRRDGVPCRQWSWSNQLLVALAGHADARGCKQWNAAGRSVKKGEHGFPILVPLTRKVETVDAETGEVKERFAIYGFKHAIVFGADQTDGKPLPPPDPRIAEWLASLPLVDVAKSWGLRVDAYSGRPGSAHGKYCPGWSIALGVENRSTWAHELLHAADDRLGNLTERGQHWRSEIVAELGGAVLLECLGMPADADLGGCWQYVRAYATDAGIEPIAACQRVLTRLCDAVALVLETASALVAGDAA